MFKNRLKERLKKGEVVIGSFVTCNSPDIVEVLALSGFEFVVIDTEHGPMSVESTVNLIRAAEARGITPITRVAQPSETAILRSLDVGTHGVQVPQVNSGELAERVVQYSKYFPEGNRGIALPRAARYGLMKPLEYFKTANEQTMVIVHCENKQALDSIEEIACVKGIDVIFLGPFDLSQSLGIPGQVNHPLIEEACQKVVSTCKKYGKAPGIFVIDGTQARIRANQGFQYITIGLDLLLLSKIYTHEIKNFIERQ